MPTMRKGVKDMEKSREQYEAARQKELERGRQKEDAARRILEIAAELRLTWKEFDQTMELVRNMAYLSL